LSYKELMTDSEFEQIMEPNPFGEGTNRQFHEVIGDRSVIVKETMADFGGQNYIEWFIWHNISQTALAPIFGRCFAISPTGRYLMMERLYDLPKEESFMTPTPPDWVTNIKGVEMFGKKPNGEVKIRDYGLVNLGDALAHALRWRRPWQDPEPTHWPNTDKARH